jgi:DeoR/GlpR family transcriptional regulator of sugar metabolism
MPCIFSTFSRKVGGNGAHLFRAGGHEFMQSMVIRAPRLLTEERRREIAGILEQQGRITVEEVRRKFGISAVTARGDLDALSASGLLVRSHGGGIKPLDSGPDYPLKVRENIRRDEKVRIARAALELIRPFQTVILCTGSTSAELAAQLRRSGLENVAVITYALNIAAKLADTPNLSLIMIGGILRNVSNAFVGPQAETMMASLHADHLFLSAVGIDVESGPTTIDILEAQLNSRMVRAAREVTVIADSSKLGQRSLAVITRLENVHRLITDTEAPAATVEQLKSRGVQVMLV